MEIKNELTSPNAGRSKCLSASDSISGGGMRPDHPHPMSFATLTPSTSPRGGGENKIVTIARAWIGTPYVHQASVKGAGCDCLGLLRGVWREMRGAEAEDIPPYAADWTGGEETLRDGLARHLTAIDLCDIAPGDVALFRMVAHGPAKHCGIIAERDGSLTMVHSRQNKRVSEEIFSPVWRKKLAYAFRI